VQFRGRKRGIHRGQHSTPGEVRPAPDGLISSLGLPFGLVLIVSIGAAHVKPHRWGGVASLPLRCLRFGFLLEAFQV